VTNFPSEGCILLLAWSFFVLGVDVRGAHAAAAAGLARVLTSDAIVTANALNALLRLCSSLTGTVLSFLAFAQAALRLFFYRNRKPKLKSRELVFSLILMKAIRKL
jgi:hypothetical protein